MVIEDSRESTASRIRVPGFGFRVPGFGFRVSDPGLPVSSFGFPWVSGLGKPDGDRGFERGDRFEERDISDQVPHRYHLRTFSNVHRMFFHTFIIKIKRL